MQDRINNALAALAAYPYDYAEALQECPTLESLLADCEPRIDADADSAKLREYLDGDAKGDALTIECALDLARAHLLEAIERRQSETGASYEEMMDRDDILADILASRDERVVADAYLQQRIIEDAEDAEEGAR